jgi:hypothetical protein
VPRKPDPAQPARTEAARLFHKIGLRRMRRVILLARQGRADPDPAVAASALEWARALLATEPVHPELDTSPPRRLVAALVGAVTFGFVDDFNDWLRDRSLRRDARQILRAAEAGTDGTADVRPAST